MKDILYQLLDMRKDKRYRCGLLQGAVSFGVITHAEWQTLTAKYVNASEST